MFEISPAHAAYVVFNQAEVDKTWVIFFNEKEDDEPMGGTSKAVKIHSCCDLAGIDVKKAMYVYFTMVLNKDVGAMRTEEFLGYLTSDRQKLVDHLV